MPTHPWPYTHEHTPTSIRVTLVDSVGLKKYMKFKSSVVREFWEELEEEKYSMEAITHLRGICTSWLIDHIQIEDQAIVGRGISKWASELTFTQLETQRNGGKE